jgi:ATP-dependent DNA helicase RecG
MRIATASRSCIKSFCVLVYPDDDGDRERLEILTQCNDGFRIADEDLRLRGPGQLAGTVQSGAADLRFGDLLRDIDVYRAAKAAAQTIVTQDPQLAHSDHAGLRTMLATQPSTRALVISS